MPIILRGARVIDPANRVDEVRDLGLAGSLLVDPTSIAGDPRTEIIDLTGQVIAPGFIDVHVHLREPGETHKEDLASGTRAAAAGGFTTVVAMPNTRPPMDCVAALHDLAARIAGNAVVRCLPTAAITIGRSGRELTDVARLRAETAMVALTDDGSCVQEDALMAQAARLAAAHGLPLMDHCEDATAKGAGVVRPEVARRLGVPPYPRAAETRMVRRDLRLCRETGARFHLQHLSCCGSVALLREARAAGLRVTAEATPHHLALTSLAVLTQGANAKMNPPLGNEADRQALLEAVADGTIDIIATDHAPHAEWEKRGLDRAPDGSVPLPAFTNRDALLRAPFGIVGLETAFSVCLTALVVPGLLDLPTLIARFTVGPARLLGSNLGTLTPGRPADVVVFDPHARFCVDPATFRSRAQNTPFAGQELTGRITRTWVNGELRNP